MKKVIFGLLFTLIVFGGGTYVVARADDTLEKTPAAQSFEMDWMPHIETFAVTAGGALVVLLPLLKKLRKASDGFSTAKDSIETLKTEHAKMAREYAEKAAEIAARESRVANVENLLAQIVEMQKIAFLNDPHLVSNGYAKEIAQITEATNENKE